jgi:hypothetical protein
MQRINLPAKTRLEPATASIIIDAYIDNLIFSPNVREKFVAGVVLSQLEET